MRRLSSSAALKEVTRPVEFIRFALDATQFMNRKERVLVVRTKLAGPSLQHSSMEFAGSRHV